MNTLTVSVPSKVAKNYGKQIVDYRELLHFIEEKMWVDVDVTPKNENGGILHTDQEE